MARMYGCMMRMTEAGYAYGYAFTYSRPKSRK